MSKVTDPEIRAAQERLREEFPGWSIIHTNRGRWWATRGPLPKDQLSDVADLEADTFEGLSAQLQAVTGR